MWETWVPSLEWEDPLEKGMATLSSILLWRIPIDRGAWWATVHGVPKSWIELSDFDFYISTVYMAIVQRKEFGVDNEVQH